MRVELEPSLVSVDVILTLFQGAPFRDVPNPGLKPWAKSSYAFRLRHHLHRRSNRDAASSNKVGVHIPCSALHIPGYEATKLEARLMASARITVLNKNER